MRIHLSSFSVPTLIFLTAFNTTSSAATFYVNNITGLDSYNGLLPVTGSAGAGPKYTVAGAIAAAANDDTISIASTGLAYGDLNTNGKSLVFTTNGGAAVVTNLLITNPAKYIGPYVLDSAGTLTLSVAITNSNNITLRSGCTIIRSAGSFDVAPIYAGAYNLSYAGNADITTTATEWPAAALITNLTVAMSGADLRLAANRSVANFMLNCDTSGGIDLSNGGSAFTLTVTGLTTLAKGTLMTTTVGGTLIVQGDVNAAGGAFGATVQMAFTGASNQTVTIPAGGARIGNVTINKTSGTNSVTITGGDLTCSGVVTFNNGLIKTGATNALVLTNGAGASTAKGYVRSLAVGGTSHVVGNVKQNLQFSTLIAYARNEFPVGDTVNYRPVALTFLSTSSGNFDIFGTVSHTNSRPTGTAGLPIVNGIVDGVPLAKYPSFFWSIKTDGPMGATAFNLDLSAAGFDPNELDLNDLGMNRVKIIRRNVITTDIQWILQGTRDSYDNVVSADIPTVTAVNAIGGLSTTGAIFTYGLKSNLYILNTIPAQASISGQAIKVLLSKPQVFGGNSGTLTYSAASSNTTIATATMSADTVIVNFLLAGSAVISVTATDVDGSQIMTYFNVAVVCGCVDVSGMITYGTSTNTIGFVTVKLIPMSGSDYTAMSNFQGTFSMGGNVSSGTYTLTALKTGSWGGVTGADALAVARHVAGIELLTGLPLQAADVNKSGTVTGADALLIVRRAAGIDTSFVAGDWVFSSQTITPGTSNQVVNVTGLAVGDVNESYTPSSGMAFAKSNIPDVK